jgi:deoxyadenosine/deoxycytidine kinase
MATEEKQQNNIGLMYHFPNLITMSGIIGVGKTTLADSLAKKLGWDIYHEIGPDENVLAEYYKDQEKNSFSLQFHLLGKRAMQYNQIIYNEKDAIIDRSPYEDSAFAHLLCTMGFIKKNEYEIYQKMTRVIRCNMRTPTVIVHLDVEPATALERIKKRDRVYERGMTLEFLVGLRDAYEMLLKQLAKEIPIIRIKWDCFVDVDLVAERLIKEINALDLTRCIEF